MIIIPCKKHLILELRTNLPEHEKKSLVKYINILLCRKTSFSNRMILILTVGLMIGLF